MYFRTLILIALFVLLAGGALAWGLQSFALFSLVAPVVSGALVCVGVADKFLGFVYYEKEDTQ